MASIVRSSILTPLIRGLLLLMAVVIGFLLEPPWASAGGTLDQLHGVLCLLVAAAVAVGLKWRIKQADKFLKWFAFGCAVAGCFIWLTVSYARDLPFQFVAGLAMLALLLVLLQLMLRVPLGLAVAANTLILLCLGLPVADFLVRSPRSPVPGPQDRLYSYAVAGSDPEAFRRWWDSYRDQWETMGRQVFMSDPEGLTPLRLRPNSEGWLFRSRIKINRLGFRGPEIREPKGDTFRIVAIGESTTFGCTLEEGDRPWPELLEEMLQERIKLRRPIEVINAGVPACSLEHNVGRLAADILPLKPDMIISYHGFNGFRLLDEALPPVSGPSPPPYQRRPLKLLADCEYKLKMLRFMKERQTKSAKLPAPRDIADSRYAQAYQQLIEIARTNGITLVLADFSMAVNRASDAGVIEFYRGGFPSVYAQIAANEQHSRLVSQLGAENRLLVIDTRPALDGQNEKFIDLVHLTQEGRRSLAEAVYQAIEAPLRNSIGVAGTAE